MIDPFLFQQLLSGVQTPPAAPDRYGAFMPRRYAGQDVPFDASRQARNEMLLGFGSSLLSNSSSGDLAGGLGQAVSAGLGARNQALDRFLDEESRSEGQAFQERYFDRQDRADRQVQRDRDRETMRGIEERRASEREILSREGHLDQMLEAVPEEERGPLRALYQFDPVAGRQRYAELVGEEPDEQRFFQSGRHVARVREDGTFEPAYSFPQDDSGSGAASAPTIRPNEYIDNMSTVWNQLYRQKKAELEAGLGLMEREGVSPEGIAKRQAVESDAAAYADEEAARRLGELYRGFGVEVPSPVSDRPAPPSTSPTEKILADLSNRARLLGISLSATDLAGIRQDLEAGIDPQTILDHITRSGGGP